MPTRTVIVTIALALAPLLVGCGKEIGRVAFTSTGSAPAAVPLAAGDVDFWTDIDIRYAGDASLHYEIDLEQGGVSIAKANCNPLGRISVKTSWTETNLGGSHSRRGLGKMACSAKIEKGGPTTVKATLAFSKKPTSVTLTKADLVLKQ